MRRRISTWLAGDNLDAIVCDPYTFVNLPTTGINVPILLDTQNVEHIILRRYLDHAHNPVKLAYAWLQWRKLKAWEAYVCQRSTLITACSEADRRILQNLSPDVPTLVVPNIVDVDSYSPSPQAENLSVLFQGGMDWYPNRDAVAFFISSILPRLRFLVPGVRFIVAGRNPAEHFLQRFLGVPDVEFTGTIPDMRVEMAKAAVCAVPLRIGSGTRLKILEAAAMGKAIVSTSIGAEGLTFVDAEDIVIADDPGAFAEALVRLLTDPSLRRLLGRRARRRVEVEYGFANLQQGIRQVFEELACRASTVARNAGPQDAVSGT
jgi:glycosyltransferase involved in cell wall biosynthesis